MKPPALGSRTYIERSIDRLHGILNGISADKTLRNAEIAALHTWLNENECLHDHQPFSELVALLKESLEDGIIDEDERRELKDWCREYTRKDSFYGCMETEAIRLLHGYLHGLVIDGILNDKEIHALQKWLKDFKDFREIWPFSEAHQMISSILEDGIIDEQERKTLYDFCIQFTERPVDSARIYDELYNAGFMKNGAPTLTPIKSVCNSDIIIEFDARAFCLTGPARNKRSDIHKGIERAGGITKRDVSKKLDYLVIGSKSSPCWKYSTYGGKIEKAMELKKSGVDIKIIQEDDFMPQLQQAIR